MPPMAPPIFCFRFSPAGFHFFRRFILNETAPNDSPTITSNASRHEPGAFTVSSVKRLGPGFAAIGRCSVTHPSGAHPTDAGGG